MATKLEKNNLGYLGIDYQYKLAKCFVEDPKFFGEVSNIVEPGFFTDAILRSFVGALKDYYHKNSLVPSYELLKIQLRSRANTDIEEQEIDALINKISHEVTLEGYSMIKDFAVKFFKQQNYAKIAKKIIEAVEMGDTDQFDSIQSMWEMASLAGQEDEYGYSLFDIEDKALSPKSKVPIPTGISKLDEVLNGGLEKKKIGVIIGSAGFGKSTLSTAIASYAATYKCDLNNNEGFKVLQIYFEDEDIDVARKHYARIATQEVGVDIEARNLSRTSEDANEIKSVLAAYSDREMINKNLRLKPFLTNTKSATDIELFVKKLINTGFKPDLVIIDYFECLVPEKGNYNKNSSEWKMQGDTIRKLENMAKELDVAIWVPTQGNKGSFTSDLVTMDQAGGSVIKVQAAHVIISIARTTQDQDNNRATLAVLKNRSGKSGKVWRGIKFNNGTATISCDDTIDYDDAMAWQEDVSQKNEADRLKSIRELMEQQRNNKI